MKGAEILKMLKKEEDGYYDRKSSKEGNGRAEQGGVLRATQVVDDYICGEPVLLLDGRVDPGNLREMRGDKGLPHGPQQDHQEPLWVLHH